MDRSSIKIFRRRIIFPIIFWGILIAGPGWGLPRGGGVARGNALWGNVPSTGPESTVRMAESEDGRFQATATISPKNPRLADSLTLTITTTSPADYSVTPLDLGETYGGFRVEKKGNPVPKITDGKETVLFQFTLLPTKGGTNPLLPIPILFQRTGSPDESPIRLLLPKGTVLIASDRDPASVSLSEVSGPLKKFRSHWIYYLIPIAVVLAILGFLVVSRVCRKSQSAGKNGIVLTPSERAIQELEALMASGIYRTDVKRFYLSLTEIVRRFIEETTGINAPEQTTEEFLRAVDIDTHAMFDEALRLDLARFLEFSDLVKFAKFQPTEEEILDGYEKARRTVLHDFTGQVSTSPEGPSLPERSSVVTPLKPDVTDPSESRDPYRKGGEQ